MAAELIPKTVLLLFLGAAAFMDINMRQIPVLLPAGVFAAGLILKLAFAGAIWWQILLGCVPGLVLILAGYLSRQAVGYGDGLVFIACGPFLGIINNLFLLFISLVLAALFSMAALALGKMRLRSAFAFIPFILGAYVFLLAVS